jgi:hypothetical protein
VVVEVLGASVAPHAVVAVPENFLIAEVAVPKIVLGVFQMVILLYEAAVHWVVAGDLYIVEGDYEKQKVAQAP